MFRIRAYLARHWRGEMSLPLSFIVNGQIGGALVGALVIGLLQGAIRLVASVVPAKIENSIPASIFLAVVLAVGISVLLMWAVWAHVGIARSGIRTIWSRPEVNAPPFSHVLITVFGGMAAFLPTSPSLGLAVLMIGAGLAAPWPW